MSTSDRLSRQIFEIDEVTKSKRLAIDWHVAYH